MMTVDDDALCRQSAFRFLEERTADSGGVISYQDLQHGFTFNGERIALAGMQGIWKPRQFALPISIRTGIANQYGDEIDDDGYVAYRYFQTDPEHPSNVGLRRCMWEAQPLIYLQAVTAGLYFAHWPMFIVGDDPGSLTFTAACDDPAVLNSEDLDLPIDARRHYSARVAVTRLHQARFRQRILVAYRSSCAVCRLRHEPLLDAAHILPDRHERGDPVVSNGLSLCKIHHAAFDANILGIRPDRRVEIRSDILEERDGPMLQYGLQAVHGSTLAVVPKKAQDQPDPERLEERYTAFREAS